MERPANILKMFLVLLFIESLVVCCTEADSSVSCIKSEREVLLKFRQGLIDPSNRLFSWVGEDCCAWKGVTCSNRTGHVIKLDLHSNDNESFSYLGGEINDSLLNLTHLNYLDLSMNSFSEIEIPRFFGSITSLKYLNLSHTDFKGKVPYHLGNLSNLQYLDLSWNRDLIVNNLDFVSTLSSLKHLNLSGLNLTKDDKYLNSISMLPSLVELHLSNCELLLVPHFLLINFTSLAVLDLSFNHLNSILPNWLFNISTIQHLDLSHNSFRGSLSSELGKFSSLAVLDLSWNELEGEIPETLRNLCNLQMLNLGGNSFSGEISAVFDSPSGCIQRSLQSLIFESNYFTGSLPYNLGKFNHLKFLNLYSNALRGPIPASIGRLSRLRQLYLSHNYLNGSVPKSLGQLSNLEILDIHNNSLNGIVSELHFSKLTNLRKLYMYRNSLVFDVGPSWLPPFQIQELALFSCKLGPKFPQWLQTQKNISILEMSLTNISDNIPDWFESISSNITLLDLSYNQIGKNLPKLRKSFGAPYRFIYLSSNKFEGPLTPFPSDVVELDISNNLLWGSIPQTIGNMMPRLTLLHLHNNSLNGTLPVSLCKMAELRFLDLSKNHLSGRLPQYCWRKLQHLRVMDLSKNNLTGAIPGSFAYLPQLRSLSLQNNRLQGKIPALLRRLKYLQILDLGENALDGNIPSWIGETQSSLRVLSVHSNRFDGEIPQQLCHLASLSVLNLANNKMIGTIPSCFENFTAMIENKRKLRQYWPYGFTTFGFVYGFQSAEYNENVLVHIKGRTLEYSKTLPFLSSIDLSRNNFVGEIPDELMSLSGLQNLNLYGNHLTGRIPSKIGNLKLLESLDLSRNELSGSIPSSISNLNFLSHLNLSFNNLSGHIPLGNQLQTLDDKSIYIGNNGLCGHPLKSCLEDEMPKSRKRVEERIDDQFDKLWFYYGLKMGLVVGFVGVCCTLYFKDSWRYAYFQSVDKIYNKLWVTIAVNVNKFRR